MYVITGSRAGEPFRTSRVQKMSAVVLGMRLSEEGYTDVFVTSADGARRRFDDFRRWALIQLKMRRGRFT